MSGVLKGEHFLSVDDYLDGETLAEERHEYIAGQVYATAGASEDHEVVAGNLFAAILAHLRGQRCRVFKGDMKVRLKLNLQDLFYYPDIMVVRDPGDREPAFKSRPKVIVEVMTDYKSDHVEKLFAYQQIESLEEHLIIGQDAAKPQAWIYRRKNGWQKEEGAPEGVVGLECLGFRSLLADLYVME